MYLSKVQIIENGKVKKCGEYSELKNEVADKDSITHYKNCLITPGFIDTHIHAAQSLAVAAYGLKLLDWLDNYIFPSESSFDDPAIAEKHLHYFFDLMLRNGTTTACIHAPAQLGACNTFFEIADKLNMRVVAGKVMMDRNGAPNLLTSAQQNYDDSKTLIQKWNNKSRISYAITPRFAVSCSNDLLAGCQALAKEYPKAYIQTHIHENKNEVHAVKELYCWAKNYLDVYTHYDLVRERSVFAHCIHFTENEMRTLGERNGVVSWCPVSNNFLGSGLFRFFKFSEYTENITLGCDYAGGNTASMLAVLDDAYKVTLLQDYKLSTMIRWYLATLGAAKALRLDDKIGNFTPGKEADFIVIDPNGVSDVSHRMETVQDLYELLFVLMSLGNEGLIKETYLAGKKYQKES